jgi:uncharacterized protein YndB with AHSA1/START domain
MKWLKRIALVILTLVVFTCLGLFAAAQRSDAGHNHATIQIARPAGPVYRYFTDYEQVKRWVPLLKGITYVKGDKFEVGAVARLTMEGAQEDEEIVAIEPGKRLGLKLHGTGGEFDEDCDYLFDEAGGVTTVRVEAHTKYHGGFVLLEPLITPAADQSLADSLAQLKALAEKEIAP